MLNRETLPVWMLADALIGIGSLGAIATVLFLSGLLLPGGQFATADQLRDELRRATDERKQIESENDLLRTQEERREALIADLERYHREAAAWIEASQERTAAMARQLKQEKGFHQQMLNLRGDLSRTLFVIDVSGSMGQAAAKPLERPNWGDDGNPWTYVTNQVDSWLAHLPVGSFRILCFNHEIVEFPGDAGWSSGVEGHADARQFLATMKPGGFTFTQAALKRAFECQPTTIILFTDGAPSDDKGSLDVSHQERILALISNRKEQIPVNVVALNDYFAPELGSFLHRLAGRTGGGFIGL